MSNIGWAFSVTFVELARCIRHIFLHMPQRRPFRYLLSFLHVPDEESGAQKGQWLPVTQLTPGRILVKVGFSVTKAITLKPCYSLPLPCSVLWDSQVFPIPSSHHPRTYQLQHLPLLEVCPGCASHLCSVCRETEVCHLVATAFLFLLSF